MILLRRPGVLRVLAAGLLVSLLPALAAPLVRASDAVSPHVYARWMQSRVAGESSPQTDAAVAAAVVSRATSLEAFVRAFVDALVEEQGPAAASELLVGAPHSAEALAELLLLDLRGLAPGAFPPNTAWFTAATSRAFGPDRVSVTALQIPFDGAHLQGALSADLPGIVRGSTPADGHLTKRQPNAP